MKCIIFLIKDRENTMPEISIICTVKNGEKTIEHTINSVLHQTFKDWEFVIVDDGSTDKTLEILEKFKKHYKQLRILKTNGIGRGKALNLAIKESRGKYIVNIDCDDLIHPRKLEIQYTLFEKYNLDYFILCTRFIIIYENQNISWEQIKFQSSDILVEDITNKNLIKNQVDHSSVMMRKDILQSLGGYQETRRSQFDYELWLRAGFMGYKIGRINKYLVAKRIHVNQSFESKRYGQLFRSILLQINYILKHKRIPLLIFPLGRLLLGILPFKIRNKINKLIRL